MSDLLSGNTSAAKEQVGNCVNAAKMINAIQNIINGVRYLFGDDFRAHRAYDFNEDLFCEIQKQVCNGLLNQSEVGAFRDTDVGAFGSHVSYCLPGQIRYRLRALVLFVNQKIEK